MQYIYMLEIEKQDQSGQTINKRLMSFDNERMAFIHAEFEMKDTWTQSIKIVRVARGF